MDRNAFIPILGFFLIAISAFSQSLFEVNYTMEDGLPSNFVYRAVQDDDGYIWFCTDKGLVKFDGSTFKNINLSDKLPHNDVFDIHLDKDGKLWLSTFNIICYIKNDSIHVLDMPNEQEPGLVNHRFTNKEHHGIEFRSNDWRYFYIVNDQISEFSSSIKGYITNIQDTSNYVIISQEKDKKLLKSIRDNKINFLSEGEILPSYFKHGPVQYKDSNYLFEKERVVIFNAHKAETKTYVNIWGENPEINKIRYHYDVFIFYGNKNNFVTNHKLEIQNSHQHLLDRNYNSFIEDDEGNMWLCGNAGISYINANPLAATLYAIDDKEDSFVSILSYKDDEVIVATKTGTISKIKWNKEIKYLQQLNFESVHKIKLTPDKETVFIHDYISGLYSFNIDGDSQQEITKQEPDRNKVSSIKDFDLLTSDQIGIAHSRGAIIQHGPKNHSLHAKRSYSIHMNNDTTYVGTTDGLYIFHDTISTKFNANSFNLFVHNLYSDNSGTLWLMTNNGGLWRKSEDKISLINETKNLFVNNMVTDKYNDIWLATTSGLYRIDNEVGDTSKIQKYGNSYGIMDKNIVDLTHTENYIYAITEKKIYRLPITKNSLVKKSNFYFLDTYVDNALKSDDEIKELKYSENNIEINYTTISYSDLGEFTYKWKLLPSSSDWQITSENKITFNSLSPGAYELIIGVYDSGGKKLHENKSLKFKINKPWFTTNSFYLCCILALGLLFYLFDKRRQRIQKKKAEEQNEIQRQFYELRLKAVQAQMNPHFIFNALNSIQKFIYQKSPDQANHYISKFAKLMRMILESTNKNYSTLQEEIELLNNYISLEQLRFDHSFNYFLVVDEDLQPHELLIPSTIMQPFVENAINHGLATKEQEGNLWIRFYTNDNKLIAEVEDDGIGREKAKSLKKRNHKSRALDIIKERKQILQQRDNYYLDFKYEDRQENEFKSEGTKLILSIPIIYDD